MTCTMSRKISWLLSSTTNPEFFTKYTSARCFTHLSANSSYVGAMVFSLRSHVDATELLNRYDKKQSTEPLDREAQVPHTLVVDNASP